MFLPSIGALLAVSGTGLIFGAKHALEADHMVAVSTMVSQVRTARISWLIGAMWGAGHTCSLAVVGLAMLVFKTTVPPHMALFFEFAVGMMLLVLGLDVFRRIIIGEMHRHAHSHGARVHAHGHSHAHSPSHTGGGRRAFVVGAVHGLAGSGVIALLVTSALSDVREALIFLASFGAGSVAGMVAMTVLLGIPLKFASTLPQLTQKVMILSGSASVAFGIFIMVQVARQSVV